MGWVDAETVTSLIEAHGADRAAVLRPAFRGEAGWPALVPIVHLETLRALDAGLMPGPLVEALAAAVGGRLVELGDPGTVHDLDTPRAELPPFEAPAGARLRAPPRVGLAGRRRPRRASRSGPDGRLTGVAVAARRDSSQGT